MNPSTRWRKALLTLHVAASTSVLGAALVLLALGVSGLRSADPRTVYPAISIVESWLVAPLAIIALVTGLAQALRNGWGLTRYWWPAVKLAVTAVLTALVLFVLGPALASAADAAPQGALGDAQRVRIAVFPAIACALLLVNVGLGVYKPGRRLRSGHGAASTTGIT